MYTTRNGGFVGEQGLLLLLMYIDVDTGSDGSEY